MQIDRVIEMLNEIIERIARIIDPVAWHPFDTSFDNGYWVMMRLNSVDKAKAAIAAMREPTDDMSIIGALTRNNDPQPLVNCITIGEAGSIYRAMIDAALKE